MNEIHQQHIAFIWEIANLLRGPYRPPQYRRVMLPLIVLRRLDCVLEPTKDAVLAEHKALKARGLGDDTIEKTIRRKFKLHFYNTSRFTFQKLLGDPNNLARNLVAYMKSFSGDARDIISHFKFEEEIQKLDEANRLFEIIKQFAAIDLHPNRVPNMAMGYIFEELVRKFNEQANEEAGDHFTPREVIHLMVHVLFNPDDEVFTEKGKVRTLYDPCCGTGGMLSVAEEYVREHAPDLTLKVFGQEFNPEAYAICGSDLMIKGEETENVIFGDTLGDGKTRDGHPDKKFHYMLANPPFGVEWKPEKVEVTKEHEDLGFSGRFGPGLPRIDDGALLFLLHMMSKMHPSPAKGGEGSRIGIVFNGSPLFTGDAGSGASNIRRWIIENDWLEAIIALPDQMFYNTGIYTYIWIVTNRKEKARKGKVQLVNAISMYQKMRKSLGNKRNELSEAHIADITRLYAEFKQNEYVKIFDNEDFGYAKITVERPLRLNFEASPERIAHLQDETAFKDLTESKKRKDKKTAAAEIEAGKKLQAAIIKALKPLERKGLYKNREAFTDDLDTTLNTADLKLPAPLKKAILSALSERDETADICADKDSNPEPDPELRDTENVALPKGVKLPLPLGYTDKEDNSVIVKLLRDTCNAYFDREVKPYVSDAWIDFSKTKIGYEIPVNRHFYVYEPPRPLPEIQTEIRTLESEIMKLLSDAAQ